MQAATGTRRHRTFVRLVIVAVILIGLLVAADRIGKVVAEHETADTLRSSQHLSSTPDVEISGFPFLTQFASGDYDKVTIDAKNVVLRPRGVSLNVHSVHVVLRHVTVSRSFSSVRAGTADATALITYADLGQTLQSTITYAGAGTVRAQRTVTALGKSATVTVTSTPTLVGNAISFGSTQVQGTNLPKAVLALARTVFAANLPLTGIPFGVQVRSLAVDATGVRVVLGGRDLAYN